MATKFLKSTLNLTVATSAYTDGDVVGGLLSFDVSGLSVNGGILNKIVMIDEDSQAEPYKLYLFNAQPTTIADDAAYAPLIADLQKLNAVVSIAAGDYTTINSMDYVLKSDINEVIHSSTNTLYGYLVATGGTPDYTNADTLQITLYIVSEQ
jgi:hypothetical protein